MAKARYLVEAHLLEGRSVSELAAAHGVHRSWIYKLLARYREGGYGKDAYPVGSGADAKRVLSPLAEAVDPDSLEILSPQRLDEILTQLPQRRSAACADDLSGFVGNWPNEHCRSGSPDGFGNKPWARD